MKEKFIWEKCQNKTDEELVLLTKKNALYYSCLINRYEEKIKRYIGRLSGAEKETLEDITQEVFLKAYINLNSFNQELKFSSWLYRIAHNETISHWRRNKLANSNSVSFDELDFLKTILGDGKNMEDQVYWKLDGEQAVKALERLDEKYRAVLVLAFLEDKSYQEIAEILKKPIGTVGTLISRAKKRLVEELRK